MSTIYEQALDWVVLRHRRDLAPHEAAAFDAWYAADSRHRGAYLRATAIHAMLDQATVQESLKPRPERLEQEWAGSSWQPAARRRLWITYGAIAASLAVMAGTWFAPFSTGEPALQTAQGEQRRLPLADHSVVNLNSASRVSVKYTDTGRQVRLQQGEAWFEVAKDKTKPFVVEAGDVRVRAVGTAFSVRRYGNGAEVLVTEGKVEVWNADGAGRRQLLLAGQQAFVPDQPAEITVRREPQEIQRKLAWREGKLIFKNQTLGDAVADFNRYSRKKFDIVDPGLAGTTLVGHYRIDQPERFARDVSAFLDVPVAVTKDRILIGGTASQRAAPVPDDR
jgi:transmembrane sensor